ncbi:MAG: redoxin domain-containing protein [Gammaproteobacteria bacterium]|nr:redoxin domain-containing protein [Gammaproteobacteria bacterium]
MMKLFRRMVPLGAGLLALALTACVGARAAPVPLPADVPWYNVSRPLDWSDLAGRVVLLDFFTPGCINCIHMLPVEDKLAERFGERLVIIGVDSPKFTNSATTAGLVNFITEYDIRHPVLLDAQSKLWDAWNVVAWPTLILVGPNGEPLGRFIGEKSFAELAAPIRKALAEAPPARSLKPLPRLVMAMDGGMLDAPGGIAVDKKLVAVSDTGHDRVVLANREGAVQAVIGGCASHAFQRPHGLDFHAGKLYVADTMGQRIRVIDLKTHAVTTLAGSGERGFVLHGRFAADKAPFNSPWDIEWARGGLYIAMAGDHQVWLYDPASGQVGPWAGSGREGLRDGGRRSAQFAQPSGLAAHDGTLYVADAESSAIRAIALGEGEVDTLIGQGLFRFGLRDGPAGEALLQHAEDVIWHDGSLYIADTFNNALRRLDLATGRVSTIAKGLKQPQALTALDADTLLVAEAGANRIVAVHLPDGKVEPWTLEGLAKFGCESPKEGDER